ncbi:MAG: hypothetical protein ABW196_09550 [Solirubrobacterales bacterium]
MSGWAEASTWSGDGLRREVFFFASGGVELYGSLYASAGVTRPLGLLACGSWGVEADRTEPLLRSAAIGMAKLGGAGLVFHHPGHGDSCGDPAAVGLEELSQGAVDALAEGSRRCPDVEWILAGFVLGASIACLARQQAGAGPLLFVQPELQPGAYFKRLASSRRPLAPGSSPREMMHAGKVPGMAYGYPVPRRIAEHGGAADAAVEAALSAFTGEGAVIRHEAPDGPDLAPARFERIEVPGAWRFGAQNHPRLAAATVAWLERRSGDE